MCTFISITLPVSANIGACHALFSAHRLTLDAMEASGQPKGVLATENYYFTCNGHCDCGTRLGSSYREIETHSKAIEDAIVSDLHKKGWSDAKILRRLGDLKKTKAKERRTEESRSVHFGNELESWIALIQKLFNQKLTSHIGITVNDYSGPLNNPKFNLKRVELCRRTLKSEALESLAPATLLIIK